MHGMSKAIGKDGAPFEKCLEREGEKEHFSHRLFSGLSIPRFLRWSVNQLNNVHT